MGEREWLYLACALSALACVLCAALCVAVGTRRRAQDRRARDAQSAMAGMFKAQDEGLYRAFHELSQQNEYRLDSLAGQVTAGDARQEDRLARMETRFQQLTQENARQLDEMRRTVDEKLSETLGKRLGDSFSMVAGRLEQLYKGMGEMQKLAGGVDDLKRVLGNVKSRGTWGEVQLGALLADTLSPDQYERNVMVKPASGERVEFAVRLPGAGDGQPLYLPVDSKFPLADYERLNAAAACGDTTARDRARAQLLAAVRVEAKRISDKYIAPPHTTDFAVMFLPTEGLYAEVLQNMTDISDMQSRLHVVPAGPSTLSALLSSLRMGFRSLAIEKRSGEVWTLLVAVKSDFARFADLLVKAQERITQANDSLESAARQTRRIQKKLRDVEDASGLLPDIQQTDEGE